MNKRQKQKRYPCIVARRDKMLADWRAGKPISLRDVVELDREICQVATDIDPIWVMWAYMLDHSTSVVG